jgi:hypothetical protein
LIIATPVGFPGITLEQFVNEVAGLHFVQGPDTTAEHIDGHVFDVIFVGVVVRNDLVDEIELLLGDTGTAITV